MNKNLILTVLVLLAGCATLGDAVLPAVAQTAGLAAEWAVKKYPENKQQFAAAEKALGLYLSEATLTQEKLIEVLRTAGLDEAGWAGPNGDMYIQAGLVVWQLVGSVNHVIVNDKWVQSIGTSVQAGLNRGLLSLAAAPAVRGSVPAVTYTVRNHTGTRLIHK